VGGRARPSAHARARGGRDKKERKDAILIDFRLDRASIIATLSQAAIKIIESSDTRGMKGPFLQRDNAEKRIKAAIK